MPLGADDPSKIPQSRRISAMCSSISMSKRPVTEALLLDTQPAHNPVPRDSVVRFGVEGGLVFRCFEARVSMYIAFIDPFAIFEFILSAGGASNDDKLIIT